MIYRNNNRILAASSLTLALLAILSACSSESELRFTDSFIQDHDFTVELNSDGDGLNISFTPQSDASYQLTRSSESGCSADTCADYLVLTISDDGTATDSLPADTYYYKLTVSLSGISDKFSTQYPPAGILPEDFTATAGNGQVTLSWTPYSDDTTYNIYRSSDSDCELVNYTSCANNALFTSKSSPFVDTGLSNGTTYYYWIEAVVDGVTYLGGSSVSAIPSGDEGSNINLTDGLVAHYEFEGNADDSSGNNYNGEVVGATLTSDRHGNDDGAYYFDNQTHSEYFYTKDYIVFPEFTLPSVSISAWIKFIDNAHSGDHSASMVSLGEHETYAINLSTNAAGDLMLAVRSNGTSLLETSVRLDGMLSDNIWHHIVATIDNDNHIVTVYFDGVKEIAEQITDSINIENETMYASLHKWDYGNSMASRFVGSLDDIRIYNRAISAVEAQALHELVNDTDVTNGLVAHYEFEGNADDSSGNGHNGEVIGATLTSDRFGDTNGAYHIAADTSYDRISLPTETVNGLEDFTIASWVKASSLNSSWNSIVSAARLGSYNELLLGYNGSAGKWGLWLAGIVYDDSFDSMDLGLEQWTHVTYTRVDSTVSIYLDGALSQSMAANDTALVVDDGGVIIGQEQDAVGGSFEASQSLNGDIDSLHIYNRALSSAEVQALYELNNNLANGLVAHYEFEGNADDSSGNGHNGEVIGAALTSDRFGGANGAYHIADDTSYDRISLPTETVNGLEDFTIASWVKASSLNSSWNSIVSAARLGSYNELLLGYNGSAGKWGLWLAGIVYDDSFDSMDLGLEQWTHVTYTRVDSTVSIYLDGALSQSMAANDTALVVDDGGVIIGQEQDAVGGSFEASQSLNGDIDSLHIYNRALSSAEVQALYELNNNLANGLVAHYEFEGDADDSSGNDNDGEEFGGVSYVDGVIGQAVSFDGIDDYIDVAHNDSLSPEILTVSVWVNIIEDNGIVNMLLKGRWNGDLTNNQREYQLNTTYGNFYGEQWNNVYLLNPAVESEWSLITLTYDKNSLRIYKNGLLDNSETFDDEINKPSNPESLTIGSAFGVENGDLGTYQNALNAKMDDLRIYNRALSAEEIQTLYELGDD